MTRNENAVFMDAMHYLDVFNDPPANDDPQATSWWEKAADALNAFSNAHEQHPLAVEIGVALYSYIEVKAKAKGGGACGT